MAPRGLAARGPDHLRVLQAPTQLARLQFPLDVLVLLDEGDGAPVLLLEEKRLLVAVEKFALLVLVDLLLQHTEVGDHDGLLEDGVFSSVFADVWFSIAPPRVFLADPLDGAGVLGHVDFEVLVVLLLDLLERCRSIGCSVG